MISSLKNYFKDNIIVNDFTSNPNDYFWFTNDDDDIIGIKKEVINEETSKLLHIFLQPKTVKSFNYTKDQQKWAQFLFEGKAETFAFQPDKPIRITQLFFSRPCLEKESFEQLLLTCFPSFSLIIWKNEQYAVVLEVGNIDVFDSENVSSFIQSVATDFYTDLHFFTGNTSTITNDLYHAYQFELEVFQKVRAVQKRSNYTIQESLPYILAVNLPTSLMNSIRVIWLEELEKDKELQHLFINLFENNLNVSLTAKQLFLHRNTLLYRIEKFYEKTGFDVRMFNHALTIYLCIIYFSNQEHTSLLK